MRVTIRKFNESDIINKINWINNPENNRFLHYDLPLEYNKTLRWFENNKSRTDRYDAVIEFKGIPVGLIGLLSIDDINKKAEYYIAVGDTQYKSKGIAYEASILLLKLAFVTFKLEKVYLYTEVDNVIAQHLFRKIGFREEGIIKKDLFYKGKFIDRMIFSIKKEEYFKKENISPIDYLGILKNNQLYCKREDLLGYCFGGNKARKGKLFFDEIDKGEYDCVVTYGSSHSNHCRIVANMAASRGIPCYIVSPLEICDETFNSKFMDIFNAKIIKVPVTKVHEVIEEKIQLLKYNGYKPYFIPGGGHGNIGTQAYVNCFDEILQYELCNNIHFDYIFFASGTGTTQAGLVCGKFINKTNHRIVGISIARKNPYGRNVVIDSIREYARERAVDFDEVSLEQEVLFIDDYIGHGYAQDSEEIRKIILNILIKYGLTLDSTYTGKAFWGMKQYIKQFSITEKNILFIHTGGTPLFFDDIRSFE